MPREHRAPCLSHQTLGDRMEVAREWEHGTYAPPRAPGIPTIFQLRPGLDVPTRLPRTWLELGALGVLGAVCLFSVFLWSC